MANTNKHHIFDKKEIRAKLIEILGEPKTQADKNYIQSETRFVWNRIPRYKVDKEKHRLIHFNAINKEKFIPKGLIKMRIEKAAQSKSDTLEKN